MNTIHRRILGAGSHRIDGIAIRIMIRWSLNPLNALHVPNQSVWLKRLRSPLYEASFRATFLQNASPECSGRAFEMNVRNASFSNFHLRSSKWKCSKREVLLENCSKFELRTPARKQNRKKRKKNQLFFQTFGGTFTSKYLEVRTPSRFEHLNERQWPSPSRKLLRYTVCPRHYVANW